MSVRAIVSLLVLMILIGTHESTPIPDGLRKVEEAFVKILGQSSHVLSFARFTHKYGKKYQHTEEIKHRFSVFKDNLDLIRSTNKKGLSYKLGVNQFADLTKEEFQRKQIGASQHQSALQRNTATSKGSHSPTKRSLLQTSAPTARDWREDGVVSRVKNQGLCVGGSWAFSATGAVESAYHIKHGTGIEISEQQLIDCSSSSRISGCIAGNNLQAFLYMRSKGINNETQYPYLGIQRECTSNSDSVVGVKYVVVVTSVGDEHEMKKAVGSIGPVSVSFRVSYALQHYVSGIYTSSVCKNILGVEQYGLVVGYGNELGVDYWIIKNSWGEQWGDGGYFKLERGKNTCDVAAFPMYPVVA